MLSAMFGEVESAAVEVAEVWISPCGSWRWFLSNRMVMRNLSEQDAAEQ